MGIRSPTTELEAKFSVAYAAAAAYLDGSAGPDSFADERVADSRYRNLTSKVTVEGDAAIRQDESFVTVRGRGESHETHVEHALGTLRQPMTDDDLIAKFTSLAAPVIGDTSTVDLARRLWRLDHEPVSDLTTTLQPTEEAAP